MSVINTTLKLLELEATKVNLAHHQRQLDKAGRANDTKAVALHTRWVMFYSRVSLRLYAESGVYMNRWAPLICTKNQKGRANAALFFNCALGAHGGGLIYS